MGALFLRKVVPLKSCTTPIEGEKREEVPGPMDQLDSLSVTTQWILCRAQKTNPSPEEVEMQARTATLTTGRMLCFASHTE